MFEPQIDRSAKHAIMFRLESTEPRILFMCEMMKYDALALCTAVTGINDRYVSRSQIFLGWVLRFICSVCLS
jgi:hypothetical protein